MTRRFLTVWILVLLASCFQSGAKARAEFIGYLNAIRPLAGQEFETDFFLVPDASQVGGEIEFISLDILESNLNGVALADYGRVQFNASAPFAAWQDETLFGLNAGFESQLVLDGFNVGATPYSITNVDPILIGTFSFDYSGLGFDTGDTVTLDVVGVDDGSGTYTTNLAARASGDLISEVVNPNFATPTGPSFRTLTIGAVPEPGSGILVLFATGVFVTLRRPIRQTVQTRFTPRVHNR